MIGKFFIIFHIAILISVAFEYFTNLNFTNYFNFPVEHRDEAHLYAVYWIVCLFSFFVGYISIRLSFSHQASKYSANFEPPKGNFFIGLSLTAASLLFLILQYGEYLLVRTTYQPPIEFNIYYRLYILSLFVSLSYLNFSSGPFNSILILINLISNLLIASRLGGAVLALHGVIFFFYGNKTKSFFFILAGIFLVTASMMLRSFNTQGLIGYFAATTYTPIHEYLIHFFSYNLNLSFWNSIATVKDAQMKFLDFRHVLVSINPLPGFLTNWYSDGLYKKQIILEVVPYSSWGLLFKFGMLFSSTFLFLIGVAVAVLDLSTKNLPRLLSLIVLFFGVLFVLYWSQYQLRSAMRYLYYAYLLSFLFHYCTRVKWKIN